MSSKWNLFIDDERNPTDPAHWVVCRSTAEAITQVEQRGQFPQEIAFDHDLGGDDTSMQFIRWMIDAYYDGQYPLTTPINYTVHSQNPIGAANIRGIMDSWAANMIGLF